MTRLLLASLLALGACTATYQAFPPVPPLLAERVPAPPRSAVALIWRPGHYDWDGARYSWIAGAWVERAGHGTLWQDGYWQRDGASFGWVAAHWI